MAKIKPKNKISDAFDVQVSTSKKRSRPWRQQSNEIKQDDDSTKTTTLTKKVSKKKSIDKKEVLNNKVDEVKEIIPIKKEVVEKNQKDIPKTEQIKTQTTNNQQLTTKSSESIKDLIKKENKIKKINKGILNFFKKSPKAINRAITETAKESGKYLKESGKYIKEGSKTIGEKSKSLLKNSNAIMKDGISHLNKGTKVITDSTCSAIKKSESCFWSSTKKFFSKSGENISKSTSSLFHKSGELIHKTDGITDWMKEKVHFSFKLPETKIDESKEVPLKEIRLTRDSGQNVLIKVPLQALNGKKNETRKELLDRLTTAIIDVLPEEDNDNLIVLNLDDYFSLSKNLG